ncbi:olfactory receptor 7A10-like [Sciurus carolinensis]|uniref:olfactory receptor 7A10-like n=1 Tax=Sciurus carolinensis TaxID=30640 RepID=UPI001FB48A62|nr:olfactory receptor 7A10-like [Sciurus carolinensis]
MLVNMQTQSKVMSFEGCIMQLHFFIVFASLENFLLAVMAYDRFVAICCPLHYTVIMNLPRCVLMVVVPWILSLLHAFLQSLMVLRLSFCTDLEIPHFFCELNQVVQLACSDTFPNDLVMYVTSVLLGGVYFSAAATHNSHSGATASVMYSVVTPMLNPYIYSLTNKNIKSALKRYL